MEDKTTAAESRHDTIKQTVNQLRERASSVLSFTSRWKDMKDHLDYTNNVIQERTEELLSIQASVEQRLVLAEDKEREVNEREREFLEEQRKHVEVVEKSLKEIEPVRMLVEEKLREIGDREERFERINKSIDEKVSYVRAVEREVNEIIKEIGRKERQFEERMIGLDAKEKVVKKLFKVLESRERAMSTREVEVEGKKKKLEEGFTEIGLKEEKVEARYRRVELEEKKLEEGFKEIALKEEKVEERCKEVELKERKLVESLNTPRVQVIEPQDHNSTCVETNSNVVDHSAEASICFSVKMDGKELQVFLNERWRDHDSMRNEVEVALRLSSSPAKLVLDAMQGFYPPHLKKGDVVFDEGVIRRSCNLLLEQLMIISPPITPHVRKEAMKIAFNWMKKLRKDDEYSLEVLVFLQLVACYGLASSFDNDELLSYLKIVAQHMMAPTLFRSLGFTDKVSGNENKSFSPDVIAPDLVLNATSTTCSMLTSPPISTSTNAPTPKTPSRKQRGTKRPWTAVSAEEELLL